MLKAPATPGNGPLFGLVVAAAVVTALALRTAAALVPSMAHPDEVFQYLEQAHRLVFGYGIVPWEYRYGMRSWLVPLSLSPFMRLGHWLSPDGMLYLLLPKLAVAALSLSLLPAAYWLGARISRTHGLVALAVSAIWFEFVYFGAHVLTETAAVAMILPAAALLLAELPAGRRVALAGALLALGAILRFHYLPAIAVLVLLSCRTEFRQRWLPLASGGLVAVTLGGLVDLGMSQVPFAWLVENVHQNIVANRSADFGVSGPLEYIGMYMRRWGILLVPMLLLMLPVIRRFRPLFWMAIANLVFHSFVGHKEYRFVLLTTAIFVLLAAIGSAEWLRRLRPHLPEQGARLAPLLLVLLWGGASVALGAKETMQPRWSAFSPAFKASTSLRHVPNLCGVAVQDLPYWESGGYSHLHRPVPLYLLDQKQIAGSAAAFNAILAPAAAPPPGPYRKLSCHALPGQTSGSGYLFGTPRVCSYVRDGSCNSAGAESWRMERVMQRADQ
jgi:hypothetical protein